MLDRRNSSEIDRYFVRCWSPPPLPDKSNII
jgi:hypothetical protein